MTQSSPEYDRVHTRLRKERGPAKLQQCVWSGITAQEWAYDHTDPNPLYDRNGLAYSEDLSRYQPMTKHAHRTFDALIKRGASADEIADEARNAWDRYLDYRRDLEARQREEQRAHWSAWVGKRPILAEEIRITRVMV